MIWCTIIITVFFFQTGYVMCGKDDSFGFLAAISRFDNLNNISTFLCMGVLIYPKTVLTVATCVNRFNDENLMTAYMFNEHGRRGISSLVVGITFDQATIQRNKNIALLRLRTSLASNTRTGIMLPRTAFEAAPGSIIDIVGFTFPNDITSIQNQTTWEVNGSLLNSEHVPNLPTYSFAANNMHSDETDINLIGIGCPAVHNNRFVGLLAWIDVSDNRVIFTDVFSVIKFITRNTFYN